MKKRLLVFLIFLLPSLSQAAMYTCEYHLFHCSNVTNTCDFWGSTVVLNNPTDDNGITIIGSTSASTYGVQVATCIEQAEADDHQEPPTRN